MGELIPISGRISAVPNGDGTWTVHYRGTWKVDHEGPMRPDDLLDAQVRIDDILGKEPEGW